MSLRGKLESTNVSLLLPNLQCTSYTHHRRGEIDFNESLRQRVGLLSGVSVDVIDKVKERIVFTHGAKELCAVLKHLGYKLAVISGINKLMIGGFIPLALYVKATLQLDYAFANTLEYSEDGLLLTGNVKGDIVNGKRKEELLNVISHSEGVVREQVDLALIYIGVCCWRWCK